MNTDQHKLLKFGRALDALIRERERKPAVRKSDLKRGDMLIVHTHNSKYVISVEENGQYRVSGGWFDKKGLSPHTTTIVGATWGGSAVDTQAAVVPGLCIEFGHRVVTSQVQSVVVLPREHRN